jgi:hypothetical protein
MMALMTVMFIMGLMTMMSGYVCIYSDVCGVLRGLVTVMSMVSRLVLMTEMSVVSLITLRTAISMLSLMA